MIIVISARQAWYAAQRMKWQRRIIEMLINYIFRQPKK